MFEGQESAPDAVETVIEERIVDLDDNGNEIQEKEPELSLREELEKNWDEASSDEDSSEDDFFQAEDSTESQAEVKTSKEKKEASGSKDSAEPLEGKVGKEPIPYPTSWSPEDKAEFDSLPRKLQQRIVERESEMSEAMHEGRREAAQLRHQMEPFERVLAPVMPDLERLRIPPDRYVSNLIEMDRFVKTDTLAALRLIAENNGVDLASLVGQQPNEGSASTPENHAFMQKIRAMEQKLNGYEQEKLQNLQMQRTISEKQTQAEIAGWAAESGKDGQPLRPYFGDVYEEMMPYVDSFAYAKPKASVNEIMQEAYDYVVAKNPKIQEKMSISAKAEKTRREAEERKERIAASRRAEGSVKGAPAGTAPAKPQSLREELEANWDKLSR